MARKQDHQLLESVMAEYMALFEASWKTTTKVHYRGAFKKLLDWLGASGLQATTESLDFRTLLEFVNHLRNQPAVRGSWRGSPDVLGRARRDAEAPTVSLNSVNSRMRAIRSLVLWARDEGLIEENPFARKYHRGGGHPLLPSEETPPKGATAADLRALVRGCKGSAPIDLRDQAIVSVMLTTGIRNSGLRLLRVEDADLDRNCITFRKGKANKTLIVALQPETKAALLRYMNRARGRLLARYPVRGFESITAGRDSEYLFLASDSGYGKGEPLTASGLTQMIDRRYHRGGGTIPHFGSHRIRHGIGTILANNGMGVDEVSRVLGHSSTDVTKRYAHQTYESLGQMVGETLRRAGVTGTEQRRRRAS